MGLATILRDGFVKYARANPPTEEERSHVKTVSDATATLDKIATAWAAEANPALAGLSPNQYLLERTTPDDWRMLIIEWAELEEGDSLPAPLREAVRARLSELGPVLAQLIDDEALWAEDAPGRGYAPILAAKLAGVLRYAPAVSPLLKVVEKAGVDDMIGSAAVYALSDIGEPAGDGLCALAERYKADVESDVYARAVEILTRLKPDERTWQYLKRGLQESQEMIGLYISLAGDYGDRRALFHLNSLLEEPLSLSTHDRRECLESIELLGGVPTARARAVVDMADLRRTTAAAKVGRNDFCPCGSGKKYKKCCGKSV
ncbi:MAG: motif [Symbiobacteriaceae bacterium]|jgi:hypothetical protein|nr:motif [Symbiobacteriaceae bacterium]